MPTGLLSQTDLQKAHNISTDTLPTTANATNGNRITRAEEIILGPQSPAPDLIINQFLIPRHSKVQQAVPQVISNRYSSFTSIDFSIEEELVVIITESQCFVGSPSKGSNESSREARVYPQDLEALS
jgi:hypothetical protein